MRHGFYAAGLMGALGAGLAAQACILSAPACDLCGNTGASGTGGTTSSSGSGTSSGSVGGGGTGGSTVGCNMTPLDMDAGALMDGCGVFVASGVAPGGDGSMEKPYATLGDAALNTKVKVIYVCAGTYTETKPVVFNGGVSIFAGFSNCTGKWDGAITTASVTGPADTPAITLNGGSNHIENLDVTAPDATVAGGSSIGVLVNGGSLNMLNGKVTAGAGKAGDPGVHPADDAMLDGENGDPGKAICVSGASNKGAVGKTKTCSTGGNSAGGSGGDGGLLSGTGMMLLTAGSGTDGTVADPTQMTKGKGGAGEIPGSPNSTPCVDGTKGADGGAGSSGVGGTGIGMLAATGYTGATGADGGNGKPGQAGGGGGGALGGFGIDCSGTMNDRVGASGGAGGTAGCGGNPGTGGKAGGSSIALISVSATVSLTNVSLFTGQAGAGGKGGDGQNGGAASSGGALGAGKGSAKASCPGGGGGQGGSGGPGGGGQGGHSLGIAATGKLPKGATFNVLQIGAGKGGLGGANSTATNMGGGANGMAKDCWDFTNNVACPP
jgi:hypothetical protein